MKEWGQKGKSGNKYESNFRIQEGQILKLEMLGFSRESRVHKKKLFFFERNSLKRSFGHILHEWGLLNTINFDIMIFLVRGFKLQYEFKGLVSPAHRLQSVAAARTHGSTGAL